MRFESTTSPATSGGGSGAVSGAVAGGVTAFLGCYAWYHFSGAKSVAQSVKQTQNYVNQFKQTLAEKTPEPDEAFTWLRDTAKSYAAFVPGAKGYVDTVFDDLEKVRGKHAEEFDKIVRNAYNELKDVSTKGGANVDTAFKAWEVLQKYFNQLFELSGDAAEDILNNHPQLKEKVGGSFDQLKQMGDAYGPQAKEEVNKTWQQISDIVKGGLSAGSADKVRQLIQDKREKLQKFGDEAWSKGMEHAKPYLEKNPKVKELVESNADQLKKGNFMQLWSMVKESASSGNTEQLEKYVKDKVNQSKSMDFGNMDKWLGAVPGGASILPYLQSLQTVAEKKGPEAQKILQETMNDIKEVLSKRKDQAQKLADEVQQESK